MKLYGVAIAALPRKEDPNKVTVTCTIICMDKTPEDAELRRRKHWRDEFTILKKDEYTIDFNNTADVMGCFVRLVKTLEGVTKLQEASLAENNISQNLPVALCIGQDSRKPIGAAFFNHFFEEELPIKQNDNEQLKTRFQQATQAKQVFNQNPSYPAGFKQACTKFSELIERKCCLKWGNFTVSGKGVTDAKRQELLALKEPFKKGCLKAKKALLDYAEDQAEMFAAEIASGSGSFSYHAPSDVQNNPDKYPELTCFYWKDNKSEQPLIAQFHESFYNTYRVASNCFDKKKKYPRHFKLPLEERKPQFTDPVADMILGVSEVIFGRPIPIYEGKRNIEDIEDEPDHRKLLSEKFASLANSISSPRESASSLTAISLLPHRSIAP